MRKKSKKEKAAITFRIGKEKVIEIFPEGRTIINPRWSTDETARFFWKSVVDYCKDYIAVGKKAR